MAELEKADYVSVQYEGPIIERVYDWDLVKDNTLTAATYTLIDIPEGEAFIDGMVFVTELPVGGTSIQFAMASSGTEDNFTGALTTASLTIGSVIPLETGAFLNQTANTGIETGANLNDYYHDGTVITSLALTAITVGTYTTGGAFKILIRTLDVSKSQRSS